MKSKLVLKKYLYEHHTKVLPSCVYDRVHVCKKDEKLIAFTGIPVTDSQSIECVLHGNLEDYDIICLQIILSYGCKVKRTEYRRAFQMLLQHHMTCKIDDFARLIHTDPVWIVQVMALNWMHAQIRDIPLANAFYLSKLQNPSDEIKAQSKIRHPSEFGPLVHEALKKEKKKK